MLVQGLQAGDPELIGPYRVVRRLGSGGMGQVFLGRSPGGRLLAIKVIRPELAGDPQFRARFRREVAAAKSVSGLFTAPVVDADFDAPVPWLATAYIAGSSLAETVARRGPLPVPAVWALAAGLAEGLLAIHSAGLVHRDLKPSNVLMADDGPRVIDFGISRALEASTVTTTGMVVGSPGFMSPEQAEGHEVGPPSDVFSLGAVLVFAAAGEGPFGAGSSAALLYRLVHNPPDLDRVPAGLRSLIGRCLDKDPGGRPSPGELLAELGGTGLAPGVPAPGVSFPGDPATFTRPYPSEPTVPAGRGGGSAVMPPGRRRRPLVVAGLAATALAVAVAVATGVAIANSEHPNAQGEPGARTQATATRSASPAASAPATLRPRSGPGTPSTSPTARPRPAPTPPSGLSPAHLAGTWTGTYFCRQGWTGLRLVLRAARSGRLTATFTFYAIGSNPGVSSGSFALTGSYSAQGARLSPDYWISEPANYTMVGLIARAPSHNDTVLNGNIVSPGCTTFSVSR